MRKLRVSAADLMQLYDLTSKDSAYCKKRAIKEALGLNTKPKLTIFELCKYEKITVEQFTQLIKDNPSGSNKIS